MGDHFVDIETPNIVKSKAIPKLTIEWRNLHLKAKFKNPRTRKVEEKTILSDVSGEARPGEFVVLMGPSGAGKSSLLDCISGRNPAVQGSITVNGEPWTKAVKRLASYVMQDDLFYETITVHEHLVFQARLRMGKTLSREQQAQRVASVMEDLGLTKCRDSLIGGQSIRGLSGGERKRLSFATEALTNPSLLFVDEPTSGLDSFMAETVVAQLQQMARNGRTVIATIHQPSSAIYALFDVLYLLVDGGTVYHGRAADAVAYFANLGLQCPSFVNPSDFFMQQLAIMDKETNPEGVARVERLKREWLTKQQRPTADEIPMLEYVSVDIPAPAAPAKFEDRRLGVFQQTWLLCSRNLVRTVRDKIGFKVLIFQELFISIILGLLFLQLDLNQKGIQNFTGVLFFISVNQTFSAANSKFVAVPAGLPIVEREFKAGLYRLGSWYLAMNLSELPLQVFLPLLFFIPIYLLVGFGGGFMVYLSMQLILILVSSAAVGLGYMVSCMSRRVDLAPVVGIVVLLPFLLLGGLFLNADNSPVYFAWVEYLSPIKYGYAGIMKIYWNQIESIPCNEGVETCVARSGADVLRSFSMQHRTVMGDVGLLLAINAFFRTMAFLALWWHFRTRK